MERYRRLLEFHQWCLADKTRLEGYERAIAQTVKAGDVVLDLGSGAGILAFFACQAGARRVYAVEADDVVELAERVSRENGFQDRIVVVRNFSSRVDLPERADVLVTDTFDNFGLQGGMLGAVIDARARLLRAHGAIIPRAVELFVVPVELPDAYQQKVEFWTGDLYGIDFSALRPFAVNHLYPVTLDERAFLSEPALLVRVRLSDVEAADVEGEVSVVARRRGTLHGIGGWCAGELSEGLRISNSPSAMTTSWTHAFFPLEGPVSLETGDRVRVRLRSNGNGKVWRWQVEARDRAFDQSNFLGFPLSTERLRRRASSYRPRLSRRGEAERFLLSLLDGIRTVGELEAELLREYPECFRSRGEAGAFVRRVVARCG
jgi:protein arginine N-methyltransferase 1